MADPTGSKSQVEHKPQGVGLSSAKLAKKGRATCPGAEPFDPVRVGKMGRGAIRGRRAQKACPCPRLFKVNPCGVPVASRMQAPRT